MLDVNSALGKLLNSSTSVIVCLNVVAVVIIPMQCSVVQ